MTLDTSTVTIPLEAGASTLAYRTQPVGRASAAYVIVLGEIWGVNANIRTLCKRLAQAGFVAALAPGSVPRRRAAGRIRPDRAAIAQSFFDRSTTRAASATAAPRSACSANGLGVAGRAPLFAWGFCMGGRFAHYARRVRARLAGVVNFYGRLVFERDRSPKPFTPLDVAGLIEAPYLGLFGEHDPYRAGARRRGAAGRVRAPRPPHHLQIFARRRARLLQRDAARRTTRRSPRDAWDSRSAFVRDREPVAVTRRRSPWRCSAAGISRGVITCPHCAPIRAYGSRGSATPRRTRCARSPARPARGSPRDVDDILAPDACAAVILSTPHTLHAEHARRCIEAGKHLLVDKPFVMHARRGRARSPRRPAHAGSWARSPSTRRFDAGCLRARELIAPARSARSATSRRCSSATSAPAGSSTRRSAAAARSPAAARTSRTCCRGSCSARRRGCARSPAPARRDRPTTGGFIELDFGALRCHLTCLARRGRPPHVGRDPDLRRRRLDRAQAPARPPARLAAHALGPRPHGRRDSRRRCDARTRDARFPRRVLGERPAPACSFADAWVSVRVVEQAFESARQGGRWLEV